MILNLILWIKFFKEYNNTRLVLLHLLEYLKMLTYATVDSTLLLFRLFSIYINKNVIFWSYQFNYKNTRYAKQTKRSNIFNCSVDSNNNCAYVYPYVRLRLNIMYSMAMSNVKFFTNYQLFYLKVEITSYIYHFAANSIILAIYPIVV